MPTCFLVLGTPRSGTSCVAGVLHHLGIPMGEVLYPPSEMNAKGSFQELEFEGCFDRVGTHVPEMLDHSLVDWLALDQLVSKRCSGCDWGAKFRLASMILPEFTERCGHDVKLLVTQRDRQQSIDSLARWCPSEYQDATECIDNAKSAVERVVGNRLLPILTVDFDKLLNDASLTVNQIADFAMRPITQAAVDFVDPNLRRYR